VVGDNEAMITVCSLGESHPDLGGRVPQEIENLPAPKPPTKSLDSMVIISHHLL
jgi:hypothetical protein